MTLTTTLKQIEKGFRLKMPKHAGGRPITMTRFVASKVYRMAAFGMSDQDISEVLDISIPVITKAKEDAEFIGYLTRARDNAVMIANRSIIGLAKGMTIKETRKGISGGQEIDILIEKEIPPSLPACESILRRYSPEEYKGDTSKTIVQILQTLKQSGQDPVEMVFGDSDRIAKPA